MSKIIEYSDDIVEYKTDIKGWVGKKNRLYYGDYKDSEHIARYNSCTHKRCKCGNLMRKSYMMCNECRKKDDIKRYYKRPYKKYKENMVVYSEEYDKWFYDRDQIIDFIIDNSINSSDLRLIVCEPNNFYGLDPYDIYENIMPDCDIDLPDEILKCFDELNNKISSCKEPISWEIGKYRTYNI